MIRTGRYFALALLLASSAGLNANISTALKNAEKKVEGFFEGVERIVVVDMGAFFDDIKGVMEGHQKDAQKKFEEHGKKRQELQAKAEDKDLSESKKNDAQKALEEHDKKGQAMMQEMQGKMMVEQGKVQKKAEERIENVRKWAKLNGYKIVVDKNQTIYHDKALDRTADAKKYLGLK